MRLQLFAFVLEFGRPRFQFGADLFDRFIEVQGTGEQRSFSREQMDQMLDLAAGGIRQLFEIQRSAIDAQPAE